MYPHLFFEEFFSLQILKNTRVFSPSNETEIMVYEVLKTIHHENVTYIDVGTGTGCILLAVVKNLSFSLWNCYALDNSPDALHVARLNFQKYAFFPRIILSYLLSGLSSKNFFPTKEVVITANLPYIAYEKKDELDHEVLTIQPHSALFWWVASWFELYRELIESIPPFMEKFSLVSVILFIEIGYDQYEIATAYLKQSWKKYEVFCDYLWWNRIVKIYFV